MFNLNDETYKKVPKQLQLEDIDILSSKLKSHIIKNNIQEFELYLHGGEPLLFPDNKLEYLFEKLKNVPIQYYLQTNGYKFPVSKLELLKENNVSIGVSIDGPKVYNDQFRKTHSNDGSYEVIMKNIYDLLDTEYSSLLNGFLAVSNPNIPPKEFFNWIKRLPLKKVDVLWPIEYNYFNTPWDRYHMSRVHYEQNPVYGIWFAELFNLWYKEDRPDILIRLFFETILVNKGFKKHSDFFRNKSMNIIVINTDLSIELHDYFRESKEFDQSRSNNLRTCEINDVIKSETFKKLLNLENQLPNKCISCKFKETCGGGFLPGRINKDRRLALNETSVLCYDQKYYFDAVEETMSLLLV